MNYLKKGWDQITNNGVDNAAQGRAVIKIRVSSVENEGAIFQVIFPKEILYSSNGA